MFRIFKRRRPGTIQLSVVTLSDDGYCAVVGESHYQEALGATSHTCTVGDEGRPTFQAMLLPEPENPYDGNAIAVFSPQGKVGYLSRDTAIEYRRLFAEVMRLGYHGGACDAYLTGGTADKPSFGVVLRLAEPDECILDLASSRLEDE